MRFLVLMLLAVSCSTPPAPVCQPGSCPAGQHCVFQAGTTDPKCTDACTADGGCTAGSCTCARYNAATQDCVQVCR